MVQKGKYVRIGSVLNGFDRNRKGTPIKLLCLTLFHTNIKCKRRIVRFTAQQYHTVIHFSKYIIENILIALYLSVLLLE